MIPLKGNVAFIMKLLDKDRSKKGKLNILKDSQQLAEKVFPPIGDGENESCRRNVV